MRTFARIFAFLLALFWVQHANGQFEPDTKRMSIVGGPYIQALDTDKVTICFLADRDCVPGILIAEKGNEKKLIQNSTDGLKHAGGTFHKVTISGLKPGKEYSYQVFAKQILQFHPYYIYYGDTIVSKEYNFKTLDAGKKDAIFTVLADIHANNEKLATHLKQEIPGNEFYFFNGDMVSYIENEDALFKGFINTSVDFFARQKPFFYIRGNHETRGIFARQFSKYFSSNNQKNYYSFTHGPVTFIVLDGGEDKADNNRYYYGLADFDAYRKEQAEWLNQLVKSPQFKDSKFKVVLVHIPVMKYADAWPGTLSNINFWGDILNNAQIDLMISGHEHKFFWYDSKSSSMKYPVLIADNNQRVEVIANQKSMHIEVKELDGTLTKSIEINK